MKKNLVLLFSLFWTTSLMAQSPFVFRENVHPSAQLNNQLAFKLYQQQSQKKSQNIFFSPFSLSAALGMLYQGTAGASRQEMDQLLGKAWENFDINALLDQAHSSSETLLNFLCVQEGIKLEKEYLDKVKAHFLLEPNYFDFRANAAGVREQLNQQVAKKTQNVIPEFLSARQVNGATRLLIANTFLFDGPWRHAFEKNATKKGTFYTLEGAQKEVPFMFLSNKRVNYFENEKYQVLELPYQDSNFGFLILLPKDKKGILSLDQDIDYQKYLNLSTIKKSQEEAISFEEIAQDQVFVPQAIDLYLPRFSFSEEWDLKNILEENGIRQIFTREANLSAMLDNADLMVDAFVHETHIEVNEWGTRASAKTTVSMVEKSIPQTKLVRADHPFFFVIRDHQNGAILFMGRVMQP